MKKLRSHADEAWKNVLEHFFKEAIEFCFSDLYEKIDWSKGWIFLDKELQTIIHGNAESKRFVDKLARVYLKDGNEKCLHVHIEIQAAKREEFKSRMFIYHYREYDKFKQHPFSCAILTDESPYWRPDNYTFEQSGCRLIFEFPVLKLIDLESRRIELEQTSNPFICIILIQLNAIKAKKSPLENRFHLKLSETKKLYQKGLSGEQIRLIFQFIDALISLPLDNELQFKNKIHEFEQVNHMPYITSIEKMGIEQGIEQGIKQGMQQVMPYITSIERMGIEQGIKQGRQEEKVEVARQLLREKVDPLLIARVTQLSLNQVQNLSAEETAN